MLNQYGGEGREQGTGRGCCSALSEAMPQALRLARYCVSFLPIKAYCLH
ncbi:hypothetical protein MC7420_1569 [Coleofasciculus chthonoplastes PCC 7420]|uniref:Uncharacterized protein n=1 Tax=Coleofasciculus chthonoplastes PCC 7420 TaxID=118168 RepID=B4W327_9CYAN|nr:hypothetical protein MC7420_1569 [Coleofasciculus chthonoplastes PCC 7420]